MVLRSSNGYLASPDPDVINVGVFHVAGFDWPQGVRKGDVMVILRYVAKEFARTVEKPRKGWCWTYAFRPNVNNPDQLSDHSSATAFDVNAPAHPNGKSGTFSAAKVRAIRKILAFCEGTVKWGGDYRFTKDEMHFGISDVTTRQDVARVADKIRRLQRQQSTVSKVVEAVQTATKRKPRALAHDGVVALANFQRGKTNKDVLEVQRILNRWYPRLDLREDGHYGRATALAVLHARRHMGLRGDITKPRTRRRILRKLRFTVI